MAEKYLFAFTSGRRGRQPFFGRRAAPLVAQSLLSFSFDCAFSCGAVYVARKHVANGRIESLPTSTSLRFLRNGLFVDAQLGWGTTAYSCNLYRYAQLIIPSRAHWLHADMFATCALLLVIADLGVKTEMNFRTQLLTDANKRFAISFNWDRNRPIFRANLLFVEVNCNWEVRAVSNAVGALVPNFISAANGRWHRMSPSARRCDSVCSTLAYGERYISVRTDVNASDEAFSPVHHGRTSRKQRSSFTHSLPATRENPSIHKFGRINFLLTQYANLRQSIQIIHASNEEKNGNDALIRH